MGTDFFRFKVNGKYKNVKSIARVDDNTIIINGTYVAVAENVGCPTCNGCIFDLPEEQGALQQCKLNITNNITCTGLSRKDNNSIIWVLSSDDNLKYFGAWISVDVMLPPIEKTKCSIDVMVEYNGDINKGYYDYREKRWCLYYAPNKRVTIEHWAYIPKKYINEK